MEEVREKEKEKDIHHLFVFISHNSFGFLGIEVEVERD